MERMSASYGVRGKGGSAAGTLSTHLHSSTCPRGTRCTSRQMMKQLPLDHICQPRTRNPSMSSLLSSSHNTHPSRRATRGAAAVKPWPTRVAAPPPRSICLTPRTLPRFPARALVLRALTLSLGTHNTHQTALSFCRSLALARLRARALSLSLSLSLSPHTQAHTNRFTRIHTRTHAHTHTNTHKHTQSRSHARHTRTHVTHVARHSVSVFACVKG